MKGILNNKCHKNEIFNFKILFIFISMVVILPPKLVQYINWTSNIRDILLLAVFSVLIFIYLALFAFRKNKKFSILLFFIILSEIVLIISTIINGVSFRYRYKLAIGIFAIVLTFELFKNLNFKNIIKALYYYFTITVFINLITCVFFPNGIVSDTTFAVESEQIYLLGKPNEFLPVFLVTAMIILIYSKVINKNKYSIFILISITINVLIVDSATGKYLWLLFIVILLVVKLRILNKNIYRLISFKLLFSVIFFAFILNSKVLFESLFVTMGRDVTLTGRTTIWNSALELFEKSPIYGYGVYQGHGLVKVSWQSWIKGSETFITCHNTYLDFMLQGGIVYLVLNMYILFLSDKYSKKCSDYKLLTLIRMLMFIYMIGMLVEGIGNSGYYYVAICLFYYLANMCNSVSNNKVLYEKYGERI